MWECETHIIIDRPLRDILNGAQSGGLAMNLDYELDYLIPRMYAYVFHDCIHLHILYF
jgi:phospholipase B1